MQLARPLSGAFLLLLVWWSLTGCDTASRVQPQLQPVRPPVHAIASAHPLATAAGMEVLAAGGNAFDAAIAVSAALAVVEPYSSGLGGGGFWLLHRASDSNQLMIDGRERAPLAAHRDLYLDNSGEVIPGLSMNGALAAGIPGEPAALAHMAEHYGVLALRQSLAPAIRLAEEGFPVDAHYRRMAQFRLAVLQEFESSEAIFLDFGDVPEEGALIKQPQLARTLRLLGAHGHNGFYAGETAEKLVAGVRAAGGIWTLEDLQDYQVVERPALTFSYLDLRIVSAPPPSSGGVALATMLHILEGFELGESGEAERVHYIVEAMRRAYRDRAEYLGDPDFVQIPLERLLDPGYAAGLRASISRDRATPSRLLASPGIDAVTGNHTTHFSILDRDGNRVAATLSINYPFGSGFVAPGTGVLLNDEMDDFSARSGTPNAYGLVGAEANAIAPGKRPLSSMSPTFIESEAGTGVLGTPGGSRIITMVMLGILDAAQGKGPASWVALPRFHHQYLPDLIEFEPGAISNPALDDLRGRGHELKALESQYGNMQALYWDYRRNQVEIASDPRGIGSAAVSR
ncbi:MAG: gamma-glutamyltransferase [Thiogranum sp.]|nr:gamma-glutamyltransferase [Thiogranum sp.]